MNKMTEKIITKSLVEHSLLRGLWSEHAQDCNCDMSNQIIYPIEKIDKLMKEGNLEEAQQVYFEYEAKRREGIIRL
jgi:hypothetical protein